MGLNTTHDAFHGAYSAFNNLRRFILKSIGGSFPPHEDKTLKEDHWYWFVDREKKYGKDSHPGLYEFFSHSDCDGYIEPDTCLLVAQDLESIMPYIRKLAKTEECYGHLLGRGGYIQATQYFIDGCRLAHERGERLEFR